MGKDPDALSLTWKWLLALLKWLPATARCPGSAPGVPAPGPMRCWATWPTPPAPIGSCCTASASGPSSPSPPTRSPTVSGAAAPAADHPILTPRRTRVATSSSDPAPGLILGPCGSGDRRRLVTGSGAARCSSQPVRGSVEPTTMRLIAFATAATTSLTPSVVTLPRGTEDCAPPPQHRPSAFAVVTRLMSTRLP